LGEVLKHGQQNEQTAWQVILHWLLGNLRWEMVKRFMIVTNCCQRFSRFWPSEKARRKL